MIKKPSDLLSEESELLREFVHAVDESELISNEEVWEKIEKKFGFKNANRIDRKSIK